MKRAPLYTLVVLRLLFLIRRRFRRRRLLFGRRSRREFSNQKPLHDDDVPLTPSSSVRYG